MSSRVSSTSWPSTAVPKAVQDLLDYFFSLMDTNSDEAGLKLIEDIFTPEATFISSSGVFKGSAEIRGSRKKAWELVESRYHSIVKVFSATSDGSDLLMIGSAILGLKNGKKIEGDFIARAVIEGIDTLEPKMSFLQAWGVRLFLCSHNLT
ncbi:uncharacterized protein A1O5_09964 [Cladophialophora psammophila CBS 110553]|uniref:SnoaL-like domain-containing protein n=1 Tax=Cladophialophora psammophila CBS 110553 TaxID=1182543 RepID=W9X8L0_9EURO|nr:uncharacterized protein A1O5_09964 [Cladophialophora psammophila CBS 110553]EXJ66769.1 hypothetical protein A1O5_09964 [Cladophialophora psammophila CBS 110553]